MVAKALTIIPFVSEMIIFFGGISADKNSMQQAMKNNKNITLIPGGFEEASIYHYNKHRLYLR